MDNRNIHTRGRAAAYLFSLLFCFMFFAQAHSASRQADSGGHPDDRISVAQNLSLHIPKVIFKSPLGHQRFWMDMQFMPDAGEDILFEVTDFGEYTTADATVDLDPAIITSVLELLLPDISDWNPPQEPRWRAIFQHQPGDEGQIYFRLTEFDELAVPGIAATLLTALDAPGNSDTAAIMDKASELHIPRLLYQPPEGDSEFSVNLHYAPDADGLPLFMLDEAATYTAAGPDPLIKPNPALLTPELAVRIPALTLMDAAGHPVTDGHWRLDLQYIPMDDGKVYVQVTDFGRTDRKQRNRNRAMLGLLSGALVEIFALDDLSRPIYTARTDAQGHFDVTLYDIPGDTLLLVKASGGSDTDANGDGLPDDSPEVNLGAIHAFATAARLQAGWITVSPVSDIGWRYSRHMLPNAPPETLSRRLDDIAVALFRRDISGDGAVNGKDLNAFNPTNGNHLLSLDFSYRRLFQHAAESAADLGDAYRRNLNAAVETLYQYQLARFSLNPLAGAPLLLSAAAQDAGSVRLQWEYDEPAALPRAQGFRIYAKESLADIILKQTRFGMLNEQSGTVHEHLFSGLRPDTDYIFSVDAFGENIWSLISNSITA
ncbi:MAG: fibronectin type III domain-containing protein, partial [Gammaproteobacteria bacterium]|nr:fibronectin type III domain-containing protein [Gammaproteobacteria bacterium]